MTDQPAPLRSFAPAAPSPWLAAWLIFATALLAYHNSFSGALALDDLNSIRDNPSIRSLRSLGAVLAPPTSAGTGGRPLANLSFALNYAISGHAWWSYHAFALGLHALSALTLAGVVRRTLQFTPLRSRFGTAAPWLGLAVGMLWVAHPLTTAAVDYLAQRTELLASLCYLATLYAFLRHAESGAGRWRTLAVLAGAAGMASKETMVTAPVMVLLFDRLLVAGSWREAWRARWPLHLGLAGTWLLLAWLMVTSHVAERGVGYERGVFGSVYALTECHALALYLKLAFWPHPLVFDYGWAYVDGPRDVLLQLLLVMALLSGTLVALWRGWKLAFAGVWFFGLLAPTSSVIPLVHQPIAESRMYLPLAMVVTLAVLGAFALLGRRPLALALAAGLAFVATTASRNRVYRSQIVLWTDTLARAPDNARAHSNLAAKLLETDHIAEALAHAAIAVRLRATYPEARINLGLALAAMGRLPEAVPHLRTAVELMPDDLAAHANLGNVLVRFGATAEAITHLETALRLDPNSLRVHNDLGVVLLDIGRAADALAHDLAAVRLDPNFPDAHYNLGNAFIALDRPAKAISAYETALRLRPHFTKAENNLGVTLLNLGRAAEAIPHFEAALRLDPSHPSARRGLEAARANSSR